MSVGTEGIWEGGWRMLFNCDNGKLGGVNKYCEELELRCGGVILLLRK